MALFRRRQPDPQLDALSVERAPVLDPERAALLSDALEALCACVSELMLDFDDLDPTEARRRVAMLVASIIAGPIGPGPRRALERVRGDVVTHAERTRTYLDDREREWRHIVSILEDGIAAFASADEDHHRRVLERGQRIERAAQLDDLRRVRAELRVEVAALRESVETKRRDDHTRMRQLASKVEALQANVEVHRKEAQTDPLTGAANRLAIEARMRHELGRVSDGRGGLALLLVDVDHFKRVNDTYGHLVGDRVLVAIVQALASRVRREDLVGRWGGEELMVLLPGATLEAGLAKARAMVEAIAARPFALEDGRRVAFTISVGVAAARPGDDAASLVLRADEALYRAKHGGRNRAEPETR